MPWSLKIVFACVAIGEDKKNLLGYYVDGKWYDEKNGPGREVEIENSILLIFDDDVKQNIRFSLGQFLGESTEHELNKNLLSTRLLQLIRTNNSMETPSGYNLSIDGNTINIADISPTPDLNVVYTTSSDDDSTICIQLFFESPWTGNIENMFIEIFSRSSTEDLLSKFLSLLAKDTSKCPINEFSIKILHESIFFVDTQGEKLSGNLSNISIDGIVFALLPTNFRWMDCRLFEKNTRSCNSSPNDAYILACTNRLLVDESIDSCDGKDLVHNYGVLPSDVEEKVDWDLSELKRCDEDQSTIELYYYAPSRRLKFLFCTVSSNCENYFEPHQHPSFSWSCARDEPLTKDYQSFVINLCNNAWEEFNRQFHVYGRSNSRCCKFMVPKINSSELVPLGIHLQTLLTDPFPPNDIYSIPLKIVGPFMRFIAISMLLLRSTTTENSKLQHPTMKMKRNQDNDADSKFVKYSPEYFLFPEMPWDVFLDFVSDVFLQQNLEFLQSFTMVGVSTISLPGLPFFSSFQCMSSHSQLVAVFVEKKE